jgi:hypothetical protein
MEEARRGIPERRTEAELVEALAEEEIRLGRPMTRREISGLALGFFAPSYTVGSCASFARLLASARSVGQGLPIKDDVGEGDR